MREGVLSGIFDPVHTGTLSRASELIRTHGLDRMVFLVRPDGGEAPLSDRLAAVRAACSAYPFPDGCAVEAEGAGADVPEGEFLLSSEETPEEQALSGRIRNRIRKGLPVGRKVPEAALDLLYMRGTYFPEEVRSRLFRCREALTEKRYAHVCRVMEQAAVYAMEYGIEPEKARLAAMLHDCAKCMDTDTLYKLSGETEYIPPVLHAPASAVLAETEYGVTDPEVLSAIRLHCTGEAGMSDLDMLIFLADMTEHGRDFPSVNEIRDAVWQSLEHGMLTALTYEEEYLLRSKAVIHPASLRAKQYFQRKENSF